MRMEQKKKCHVAKTNLLQKIVAAKKIRKTKNMAVIRAAWEIPVRQPVAVAFRQWQFFKQKTTL
ncbi:hypothetical protein CFS9_03490 [Flavobacterium sp. CFS9]|uniref:Uncharacterized protein n=1 Tax=Flavobacterium sp. CFS9 TaxID=3143118 RepID=A0AAT9GWU5_9FLAO